MKPEIRIKSNAVFTALLFILCLPAFSTVANAQWPFSSSPFTPSVSLNPVTAPVTISRPGVYTLARDIHVQSGDAITITASGVMLDLNGHQLLTGSSGTGRGVFINGVTGVSVKNGRVGAFRSNVMIVNSVNVTVTDLLITGAGLAPAAGGPSEIGVQIVNSRGAVIYSNTVTSTNLGIFVRGGNATGNRIFENTLVGGAVPTNNLLGICYNPADGQGDDAPGPRGDLVYNNHIARFGYAIAISAGTIGNIFRENTLSSFIRGFRELDALTQNGGANVAEENLETTIPATILP